MSQWVRRGDGGFVFSEFEVVFLEIRGRVGLGKERSSGVGGEKRIGAEVIECSLDW